MMRACEVLLEICVACHASFKRLEIRVIVICLIAEFLGKLRQLKQDKIRHTRLGSHQVLPAIAKQFGHYTEIS